jgi:hypothetical protein
MLALLFFLASLLINLMQYHYYKRRTDRIIQKEESILHTLFRLNKFIKKQETICKYEMEMETSLKDMGSALKTARNMVGLSINDLRLNLRSFREYRAREKTIGKHLNQINKAPTKKSGQSVSYLK